MEDPSYGFLVHRCFVHNQFMGLDKPLEDVVLYCLIGGITDLSYWDKFLMVSSLVCMVTYETRSMASHDVGY